MLLYANYDRMIQEDIKFCQPELQESIESEGATNMIKTDVKMEEGEQGDDEGEEDEFYETHDSGNNILLTSDNFLFVFF